MDSRTPTKSISLWITYTTILSCGPTLLPTLESMIHHMELSTPTNRNKDTSGDANAKKKSKFEMFITATSNKTPNII